MKITHFQVISASMMKFEFSPTAPICVLHGIYSDLALDYMRKLIGDYSVQIVSNRINDGQFVMHADIEMDGKDYEVCYICYTDSGDEDRIAVNFEPYSLNFSRDDTREFVEKCNMRDVDSSNVLFKSINIKPCDDDRPIFIYSYFDRLDEATDITPILDRLASLGRQVFISVCSGYPEINHEKAELIKL